jgi:hypothetical protein
MKNSAFVLTAIIATSTMTHGQTGSNSTPAVQTWEAGQDFGSWIKRGKLVYQTVNLNAGQLGAYVYQGRSGNWVLLSGRLDGINAILGDEIAKESAARFLDENLARLLLATMAPPRSSIIDKEFLTIYVPSGDSNSVAKLQRYKSDAKPVVAGNDWTLEFNVASDRGGIEHWRVTGRLAPFSIQSFSREIAESNGAFEPLLETGSAPGR